MTPVTRAQTDPLHETGGSDASGRKAEWTGTKSSQHDTQNRLATESADGNEDKLAADTPKKTIHHPGNTGPARDRNDKRYRINLETVLFPGLGRRRFAWKPDWSGIPCCLLSQAEQFSSSRVRTVFCCLAVFGRERTAGIVIVLIVARVYSTGFRLTRKEWPARIAVRRAMGDQYSYVFRQP